MHSSLRNFRTIFAATVLICASTTLPLTVAAQAFPSKTVRVVVPFPPGGSADLLTRAMGKRLTEIWNQPVVADNRPGAGGNIAAELVARSVPDGYTLLMGAITTHSVAMSCMSLYAKPGYDLEKDLLPVSLVAQRPAYSGGASFGAGRQSR